MVYKRVTDPHNAREAFDAGMRLVKATRYDQAILNFNRAVDLQPDFAEAYRMRGRAYVAQSHPTWPSATPSAWPNSSRTTLKH